MAVKRKTYAFKKNDIIEVEEFHDGNYGAPGQKRIKKAKPTPEQMQKVNALNKARRCRHKLLEYFTAGDLFVTWTYKIENRPSDMKAALQDFQNAMKVIRREFKKRNRELFWIRNIEKGTKGAWHIHLVINEIGDTATILKNAWKKGGQFIEEIRTNRWYEPDMSQLASYMTKDEHTVEAKKDGKPSKPRIAESSYSTSRNMPLKEPKTDKLIRWKENPKPKKGYSILKIQEGINPITGYRYRRYTMVRGGGNESRHIHSHRLYGT